MYSKRLPLDNISINTCFVIDISGKNIVLPDFREIYETGVQKERCVLYFDVIRRKNICGVYKYRTEYKEKYKRLNSLSDQPESVKFGILTMRFQVAKFESAKLAILTNISYLAQTKLWKIRNCFQAMTGFEA